MTATYLPYLLARIKNGTWPSKWWYSSSWAMFSVMSETKNEAEALCVSDRLGSYVRCTLATPIEAARNQTWRGMWLETMSGSRCMVKPKSFVYLGPKVGLTCNWRLESEPSLAKYLSVSLPNPGREAVATVVQDTSVVRCALSRCAVSSSVRSQDNLCSLHPLGALHTHAMGMYQRVPTV